jgi:hypothetical protein
MAASSNWRHQWTRARMATVDNEYAIDSGGGQREFMVAAAR